MTVAAVNETRTYARPGQHLASILNTALRGIPKEAIIDEWSSRVRPSVSPLLPEKTRRVPSVIPVAFFEHPCDEAVPFFEEVVAPLSEMEGASARVNAFFERCRARALAHFVAQSIEVNGTESTIASILEGLKGDQMTATMLQEAIVHGGVDAAPAAPPVVSVASAGSAPSPNSAVSAPSPVSVTSPPEQAVHTQPRPNPTVRTHTPAPVSTIAW